MANVRHPFLKQGTWGPASGEHVGKAQMKDTGGGRQRGTRGHSTDEGTAIQVPHCAPSCGDLTCWGWEGQRSNQEGETGHTQTSRCYPTLGMMAIMTLKSRSLLDTNSGHYPRAQMGQVVRVAADEAKMAGQSGRGTLTSGQSDLVPAMTSQHV